MKVAISMGHGFSSSRGKYAIDPGAVNEEVEITEAWAVEQCGALLMKILQNSPVDAVKIPCCSLRERIQIINIWHKEKPFDLAVEVHLNSFHQEQVRGSEVWYLQDSKIGKASAEIMQDAICNTLLSRNRGARPTERLNFLNDVVPDPILTEAEFISNPIIADELKSGILIQKIAWAHALGIWRIREKLF